MLLTLALVSATLSVASIAHTTDATVASLAGATNLAHLVGAASLRDVSTHPAALRMPMAGISGGLARSALVQQARLATTGANLHGSLEALNAAAPAEHSNFWHQSAAVSESQDCYTDLNEKIKELLNRLNKLRKLQANKQQRALVLGNLDPQQATMQTTDDTDKQEAKTSDLREIIGEHLSHLDRELVKRNCKNIQTPFDPLASSNQAQSDGATNDWLRFDPSSFDYVYNTLTTYKRMLSTIVEQLERAMGITIADYLQASEQQRDAEQLKLDLKFDSETMDKIRAALLNGIINYARDTLEIKATSKAKNILAGLLTSRSGPVSRTTIGIFGPIIDLIAGTDARMAAEILLDPGFRSGLDQANRQEPLTFLKCIDDDQVNKQQC